MACSASHLHVDLLGVQRASSLVAAKCVRSPRRRGASQCGTRCPGRGQSRSICRDLKNLQKSRLGVVQPEGRTLGLLRPRTAPKSPEISCAVRAESLRTNQSLDFAISLQRRDIDRRRISVTGPQPRRPFSRIAHASSPPGLHVRSGPRGAMPAVVLASPLGAVSARAAAPSFPTARARWPETPPRSPRAPRDWPLACRAERVSGYSTVGVAKGRIPGHQTPDRQSRAPALDAEFLGDNATDCPSDGCSIETSMPDADHDARRAAPCPRDPPPRRRTSASRRRSSPSGPCARSPPPPFAASAACSSPCPRTPIHPPRGAPDAERGQLPVRRMLHRVRRPGGRLRADSTPRLPGNQALQRGGQGEVARAAAKPEGAARGG